MSKETSSVENNALVLSKVREGPEELTLNNLGKRVKCPICGRYGRLGLHWAPSSGGRGKYLYVYLVVYHANGKYHTIRRLRDEEMILASKRARGKLRLYLSKHLQGSMPSLQAFESGEDIERRRVEALKRFRDWVTSLKYKSPLDLANYAVRIARLALSGDPELEKRWLGYYAHTFFFAAILAAGYKYNYGEAAPIHIFRDACEMFGVTQVIPVKNQRARELLEILAEAFEDMVFDYFDRKDWGSIPD